MCVGESLFSLVGYVPLLPTLHITTGPYPNAFLSGNPCTRYRDEKLTRAAILSTPPSASSRPSRSVRHFAFLRHVSIG